MLKPSIPCLSITLLLLLAAVLIAPVEGGWEVDSPHVGRLDMGPAEATFGRWDWIWTTGTERKVTVHTKKDSGEPGTATATVLYTVFPPLYIGQIVMVLVVGGLVTLWFSTRDDDDADAGGEAATT